MILLDFSNIIVGSIMIAHKTSHEEKITDDFIRHLVLNSIRNFRVKHKDKYGEIVICTDCHGSWRKGVFPQYKAHRKIKREKQKTQEGMDWSALFKTINDIIIEIDTHFPYKVISVPHAEGDDVIAVLAKNVQEKSIIISSDKDFSQLHRYKHIKQYSPIQKKMLVTSDPYKYLQEHIIRGDKGDGVPNILSADDCIVNGERQKPITKKKLAVWMEQTEMANGLSAKWKRNQQLIDFEYIPENISKGIMDSYNKTKDEQKQGQLLNYFITNRLKYLMENIEDFIR